MFFVLFTLVLGLTLAGRRLFFQPVNAIASLESGEVLISDCHCIPIVKKPSTVRRLLFDDLVKRGQGFGLERIAPVGLVSLHANCVALREGTASCLYSRLLLIIPPNPILLSTKNLII